MNLLFLPKSAGYCICSLEKEGFFSLSVKKSSLFLSEIKCSSQQLWDKIEDSAKFDTVKFLAAAQPCEIRVFSFHICQIYCHPLYNKVDTYYHQLIIYFSISEPKRITFYLKKKTQSEINTNKTAARKSKMLK